MKIKFKVIFILLIIIVIGIAGVLYWWLSYGRTKSDCDDIKDLKEMGRKCGEYADECYRFSASGCGKIEICNFIENTQIKGICECETKEVLKNKDLCNKNNNESERQKCFDYIYGKCNKSDVIH